MQKSRYWVICLLLLGITIACDTNRVFDSLSFLKEHQKSSLVYELNVVEDVAVYDGNMRHLYKDIEDSIDFQEKEVKIFVQFTVEMDSTVSSIEVLKSSHEQYNEAVINYFSSLRFIPGRIEGEAVRSKLVIMFWQVPIVVK